MKPEKEKVRVKVTRVTEYGEIKDINFLLFQRILIEDNYDLEKLGISVISKNGKFVIDNLKWNGLAKKISI